MKTNPWGLTAHEFAVMDAICRRHATKLVAFEMGIAQSAVSSAMRSAGRKMGTTGVIAKILKFDRWQRGEKC